MKPPADDGVVTIPCRVCEKGAMKRTGVARFGEGLGTLGAILIAVSLIGLLIAGGIAAVFVYSASQVLEKAPASGSGGYEVGVGIGTSFGLGLAAFIGVPSLFFFGLGLLLARRMQVWKCDRCATTAPA